MGLFSSLFASKPTPDKFGRLLVDALRRSDKQHQYHFHSESFSISRKGQHESQLNLQNFYIEYCQLPKHARHAVIEQVVHTMRSMRGEDLPPDLDAVRSHLMPKVWSSWMLESLRLESWANGHGSLALPCSEVGSHLIGALVFDQDSSMRSVSQSEMESWGLTFYEAFEIAKENLARLPTDYAKIGDNLYAVLPQDSYESSRLFNLDWIQNLDVSGDYIAIAPARGGLLVTGTENQDSWTPLFDLAEKMHHEDPRPLSMAPVRLRDGVWEDWLPPEGHPLRHRFLQAINIDLITMYNEQKELLEKIQAQGQLPDVFIGSVIAAQNKATNDVLTFTIWTKDLKAWMPKADRIAFTASMDAEPQMIEWDRVERVCKNRMRPLDDLFPPRWEVTTFPTPQEFQAMT